MQTSEIRQKFVDFYEAEGYRLLPRAPMIDDSIPMSFVMSAGLIQVERSLSQGKMRGGDRFVLVQDCFRHFDLDKVGTDDFHLSIFEMPGAFKFGSINKDDTIQQMWQLATSVLNIDKHRLWASFFKGGDILYKNNVPEDENVRQAWERVGLPVERIIGLGAKDNYWLQGRGFNGGDVVRKSGPNTELFYDRDPENPCGSHCLPGGCKCGRFIEFSNSLFICYEVIPDIGEFRNLPEPFSETVIGIERVAMILQNRKSVFEIDGYQSIMGVIDEFTHKDYVDLPSVAESKMVIADHLRALYLLVANNAPPPGKNGRERIVKLLVRGVLTRQILLGISSEIFLPIILSRIAEEMDEARSRMWICERVLEYFSSQRQQFFSTVERGYSFIEKKLNENLGRTLSGKQIVHLEKKIGIPHLLIERSLINRNLYYNRDSYENELTYWQKRKLLQ